MIGLSGADAARALANFKVERIETASAAPTGEVLTQEPGPAAVGLPGSTVTLKVSDGSLAIAESTIPVTVPVAASVTAATATTTALATGLAPASTNLPISPQEPAIPSAAGGQFPTELSIYAALIFGAGVLLGLLSGALLMRGRLLRGRPAVGEFAASLALPQRQSPFDPRPAESDVGGVSASVLSSEVRFAARFVPVETTIVLSPSAAR